MNHKRRRPKNARSGCLYCKPHKANGAKEKDPPRVRRQLQDDRTKKDAPVLEHRGVDNQELIHGR